MPSELVCFNPDCRRKYPIDKVLYKCPSCEGLIEVRNDYSSVNANALSDLWAERRVSAAIQDRVGPNRVGPAGLLQPVADGIKFLLKEDFTPNHVRKSVYWLAPALTMIPSLLTCAVIPFGSQLYPYFVYFPSFKSSLNVC